MVQTDSPLVTLAPGLRRLRAHNAGPMTFTGTNTYLIGETEIAVIDPGPDDPDHIAAIMAALEPGQSITHIFVTHAHLDHSAGARALKAASGARIHAFGSAYSGMTRSMTRLRARGISLGMERGIDTQFYPDVPLAALEVTTGEGWSLKAVHTPGHLPNHMCFLWVERDVIFSGDHVMGWATSMLAPPEGDAAAYRKSLLRLMKLKTVTTGYPGHGEPIAHFRLRLKQLKVHRYMRAGEIDYALLSGPVSPLDLARQIYTDVPDALLPAAACNVLAHLLERCEIGSVLYEGTLTLDTEFTLRKPLGPEARDTLMARIAKMRERMVKLEARISAG